MEVFTTQLEAATGDRVATLEGIGEMPHEVRNMSMDTPQMGADKEPQPPAPESKQPRGH